jgi:hypothetical protein
MKHITVTGVTEDGIQITQISPVGTFGIRKYKTPNNDICFEYYEVYTNKYIIIDEQEYDRVAKKLEYENTKT